MIDSWHFLHPEDHDFTFYSIPHKRHSRIDYLFTSQRDLQVTTAANIGIQSISDHAPISITLNLSANPAKPNMWRLNSSLLTDPVLLPKLTSLLKIFFQHNMAPDADPMMVWEADKCSIRGELIKMGTHRKREKEKEIAQLADKIHSLETLHKQSLSIHLALALLDTRKALRQILDAKTKRFLFFHKKKITMSTMTKLAKYWQWP